MTRSIALLAAFAVAGPCAAWAADGPPAPREATSSPPPQNGPSTTSWYEQSIHRGRIIAISTDLAVAVGFGIVQFAFDQPNPAPQQLPVTVGAVVFAAGATVFEDLLVDRPQSVAWLDGAGYLSGMGVGLIIWALGHELDLVVDQNVVVGTILGTALLFRLALGLIPDPECLGPVTAALTFGFWGAGMALFGIGAALQLGTMLWIGAFESLLSVVLGRVISASVHAWKRASRDAQWFNPDGVPPGLPFQVWVGPLDKGRTSTAPIATGIALQF